MRTSLRALRLLLSLISFAFFMTTRGPSGEQSLLERIPALMGAIQARLDADRRLPPPPSPDDVGDPPRAGDVAVAPDWNAPARGSEPAPAPDHPASVRGLPSGKSGVRVNRGLP